MNLSPRWVEFLRDAGLPAVHWATRGAADASDAEIMAFAAEHDYIVLTHDLDFSAILAATQGEKPSVVQIRSDDISPNAAGRQVADALRQVEEELATGALLTVDLNRARLRLLPLPPKNSGGR